MYLLFSEIRECNSLAAWCTMPIAPGSDIQGAVKGSGERLPEPSARGRSLTVKGRLLQTKASLLFCALSSVVSSSFLQTPEL